MDQPAGLPKLAVAETDARCSHQVTWFHFDNAHFAVAMIGAVGEDSGSAPGFSAVIGEDRCVGVVDLSPRKRRVPKRVRFPGFGARIDERAVGKFDHVAGLTANVVDLVGSVPRLSVVAAPEQVVGHPPVWFLPVGQHGPALAGTAMTKVGDNHQPAVTQLAELRSNPDSMVSVNILVRNRMVACPRAAFVTRVGHHDVGGDTCVGIAPAVNGDQAAAG